MPVVTGTPTNPVYFTPQQLQGFDWQYADTSWLNYNTFNKVPVSGGTTRDSDVDVRNVFLYGWLEIFKIGTTTVNTGQSWPIEIQQATDANPSLYRWRLHKSMWDSSSAATHDSDFTFMAHPTIPALTWAEGDGTIIPNGTVRSYTYLTEPLLGTPVTCVISFVIAYLDPITGQVARKVIIKGQQLIYGNVVSPIGQ